MTAGRAVGDMDVELPPTGGRPCRIHFGWRAWPSVWRFGCPSGGSVERLGFGRMFGGVGLNVWRVRSSVWRARPYVWRAGRMSGTASGAPVYGSSRRPAQHAVAPAEPFPGRRLTDSRWRLLLLRFWFSAALSHRGRCCDRRHGQPEAGNCCCPVPGSWPASALLRLLTV